jgi:hypothetical protein
VSEKQPRLEELVAVQPLKSKHLLVRPIGPPVGYMMHWITIASSKGIVNIPKLVPNYDPETDTIDDTIVDPYKSISNEVSTSRKYLVPVIVRDLQDSEPRKKRELIKIICPIHGEFNQKLEAHLNGHGCSKCGNNNRPIRQDFIKLSFSKCSYFSIL